MIFARISKTSLAIREIPEPFLEMLRSAPQWNETSGDDAESRLFPSPSEEDSSLADDWKAFVQPGLYELFMDARQVVQADLATIKTTKKLSSLEIPIRHAPAWLNVLNQARLSIAATHRFTEEDLSKSPTTFPESPRDLARLQMDFFAAIQEWIVEILSDSEDLEPEENSDEELLGEDPEL